MAVRRVTRHSLVLFVGQEFNVKNVSSARVEPSKQLFPAALFFEAVSKVDVLVLQRSAIFRQFLQTNDVSIGWGIWPGPSCNKRATST